MIKIINSTKEYEALCTAKQPAVFITYNLGWDKQDIHLMVPDGKGGYNWNYESNAYIQSAYGHLNNVG